MANELEIFEFLERDSAYEKNKSKIERRLLRIQSDPFQIDEVLFVQKYRLSKQLVYNLCEELRPHISRPTKLTDLSVETKVLTALSFYATGSYQRPTGDVAAHSMAQATVSTVIAEITKCLNMQHMRTKYIRFPQNEQERRANILKFYHKFGIPGVLGCIDCTHVGIVRPSEHEERYYCRKQYHSLNVQLVCDADMNIISVDASYGGATHDAFIWANHPLKPHMEQLSQSGGIWLLGDSGYPQRRSMMTPIVNAEPGSAEAQYTELHVRARNTVERTIGLLKARFRCLLVHRILHYTPAVAGLIVNACVILHNISNRANICVHPLSEVEASHEAQMQSVDSAHLHQSASTSAASNELNQGLIARRNLINRLQMSR